MLKTCPEILQELGSRIRGRRVSLGWSQQEAARRAGVAYRTWRRLEGQGQASIEDMVKAAMVLRCEEGLAALFPKPAAISLDDLLRQQAGTVRLSRASSSR
ncbi:MAG: helix-turn-helix transcriptional regulator [Caulobacter sp.]|nr:helix-turn-helix transcriptional regulator [Caulobacter sp.]